MRELANAWPAPTFLGIDDEGDPFFEWELRDSRRLSLHTSKGDSLAADGGAYVVLLTRMIGSMPQVTELTSWDMDRILKGETP